MFLLRNAIGGQRIVAIALLCMMSASQNLCAFGEGYAWKQQTEALVDAAADAAAAAKAPAPKQTATPAPAPKQ